jgi:hypothetical protein
VATVRLYFEPYPENDADGLKIEESADGLAGWVEIESLTAGQIGTYPDYISSFTTANATATDYFFRIAWTVGAVTQNYSDPIQVGDLAPKYTTPDLIRETTRLASLISLGTVYMQELINQAYFMVQADCGPFDETDAGFIAVAPLAMRLYVEYLFVIQDPSNLTALTGTIEETIGSYRYKKSEAGIELWREAAAGVPPNVKALLCPYAIDGDAVTEAISTTVFPQTPWYDDEQTVLEKGYVYVEGEADVLPPNPDIPNYGKFPSS